MKIAYAVLVKNKLLTSVISHIQFRVFIDYKILFKIKMK